jgi:hypothetical protein
MERDRPPHTTSETFYLLALNALLTDTPAVHPQAVGQTNAIRMFPGIASRCAYLLLGGLFGACDDAGSRTAAGPPTTEATSRLLPSSPAEPNSSSSVSTSPSTTAPRTSANEDHTPEPFPPDPTPPCEVLAGRLEVAARNRSHPRRVWLNKAIVCDSDRADGDAAGARICGTAVADHDGLLGAYYSEDDRPGAMFYAELWDEATPRRLACTTFGLRAVESHPGTEQCEQVRRGPLAGFTLLLDSRCKGLAVIMFDQHYRLLDPSVTTLPECTTPFPERESSPVLECPAFSWLQSATAPPSPGHNTHSQSPNFVHK